LAADKFGKKLLRSFDRGKKVVGKFTSVIFLNDQIKQSPNGRKFDQSGHPALQLPVNPVNPQVP
jgi:hypothetical protein